MFCELLPPSAKCVNSRKSTKNIELDYVVFDVVGATCNPWRGDYDVSSQEQLSLNSVRMMLIGSQSFGPLPGLASRATAARAITTRDNLSLRRATRIRPPKTVPWFRTRRSWSTPTPETIWPSTKRRSPEQTFPRPAPMPIPGRSSTRRNIGASRHGLAEWRHDDVSKDTPHNGDRTATQNVGTIPEGFACAQRPRSADDATSDMPQRDALAVRDIYSSMTQHGSYVVDGSGRIAASQRVIFESAQAARRWTIQFTNISSPTAACGG